MQLPSLADFLLFSAWDGYLVAIWLLVISAVTRMVAKLWKKDLGSDEMAPARWGANIARAGALAMALVSWQVLPDRGPGIWGVLAIGLIVMSYGNAICLVKRGRPLF